MVAIVSAPATPMPKRPVPAPATPMPKRPVPGQPVPNKISEEEQEKADYDKLIKLFGPTSALTVVSGAMLFSARPAVAQQLFPNATSLGLFLTRLASVGAAFEFLANPIFGKLADTYGRKSVLPVGNMAVMIVRTILFLNPTKKWPIILEQAVTIPVTTSYFTTYRAALADKISGSLFAKANAQIGAFIGLAIIAGPLLAEAIMRRAHPKYCYLMSVACAACSCGLLLTQFEETLPVEKRKPLVLTDMQPFSFMQLMRDRVLSRLMLVTGIQSLTEGRSIYDVLALYLKEDLLWEWSSVNKFVGFNGLGLVIGGVSAKGMMNGLGMRKFTTFSNFCNALVFLAWSRVPPFSGLSTTAAMYLGALLSFPGSRKRDCAESLIMTIGSEHGYGKGFISGSMNNFRALINILGPLIFGNAYAYGAKNKYPALPFMVAAFFGILSELPHRALTNEDLGLDHNGLQKTLKN